MNQGKWDAISPENQAAITELSAPAFARRVGEAWNAAYDLGEEAAAAGGMEVVDAPAEVADAIRARAEELEAAWAATLGEGYDGEAALEAFRGMTGMTQ